MSRVLLIAAEKPLPLCDKQEERTKTVEYLEHWHAPSLRGKKFVVDYFDGFRVEDHAYYRYAVDALGYTMKPFQYELSFEQNETDLGHLRDYLRENFASGETLELWSVWVGEEPHPELDRPSKSASEVDLALLEQMLWADQLCVTITM